MAAIVLEISYTRVFSFKLFYYFTYLTIGVALLGIGSGGVFVAVSERLRRVAAERLTAIVSLLAAISVPVGYLVVMNLQVNSLDISESYKELAKLVILCGVLFVPFLMVGILISTIFGAQPERISRLYFADLVGASVGCVVCVPLFNVLTPPGCVMLSGALFALASLRLADSSSRRLFWVAASTLAVLTPLMLVGGRMPDPVPDRSKSMSPQRQNDPSGFGGNILFSRWSTVFRIDVSDGPRPEVQHMINHDGNAGSTILRFNGDFASVKSHFDVDVRSTPFSVIRKNPEVLIIGAAGGHEILASLYNGAAHVTGIELNPVTVSLLTDHFADYSGRLTENPRVTLINGEGRSFVKRETKKYDLIWLVAPDSYAAMNAATSGAFVLSESYLYTQEMILDSLARLNPGGVVCLQTGDIAFDAKPNRATRYLVTVRAALERAGIENFADHLMVASVPEMFTMVTILVSKDPVTAEQAEKFRANAAIVNPVGKPSTVWHPTAGGTPPLPAHPVARVIASDDEQLESWLQTYKYNLNPVSDNSPFFWHFARFRDVFRTPLDEHDYIPDPEDSKGERVLLVMLGVTSVFSAVFLLLPLVALRNVWREVPYKINAGVYFAALGLGFMFFEICLIQKLTLFLAYPSYSLTVTLFALLISSGTGSLLSERYAQRRGAASGVLLVAISVMAWFYQYVVPVMVDQFIGLPLRHG
jgi:spermidine synthase